MVGRRPDDVAALDGILEPLKYPCACSRLEISAGLTPLYRCALMARTCESETVCGDDGRDVDLDVLSNKALGAKLSN